MKNHVSNRRGDEYGGSFDHRVRLPLEVFSAVRAAFPELVLEMMDAGEGFVLLDVRDDPEWEIAHLEGAIHIPLGELESRVDELDPSKEVIVYCHVGDRSVDVGFISGFASAGSLPPLSDAPQRGERSWFRQFLSVTGRTSRPPLPSGRCSCRLMGLRGGGRSGAGRCGHR